MGKRRHTFVEGPPIVGRCGACKTIFHSAYAMKRHDCAAAEKTEAHAMAGDAE